MAWHVGGCAVQAVDEAGQTVAVSALLATQETSRTQHAPPKREEKERRTGSDLPRRP
jgi:hypothetical protein